MVLNVLYVRVLEHNGSFSNVLYVRVLEHNGSQMFYMLEY
jgi:hypothetical protein